MSLPIKFISFGSIKVFYTKDFEGILWYKGGFGIPQDIGVHLICVMHGTGFAYICNGDMWPTVG
jgi:hypothetical protein